MQLEIDQKILDKTTKCSENFNCLTDDNHHCRNTKVETSIDSKLIFVSCDKIFCAYKVHFGDTFICNCPTRLAIYKKYNF